MNEKEEQFWSDAAFEAAKKAKQEAEAQAVASGHAEQPPPNLEQLVALTVQAFSQGKGREQVVQDVVKDIRSGAGLAFERAVNGTAQERYQSRFELYTKRYPKRKPEEAKGTLELLWTYAEKNNIAPVNIIKNPNDLVHSTVGMEFASRLTTLKFNEDVAKNPKMWWEETARAYQSIDFHDLTEAQEKELRSVFENAFTHMRELAKQAPEGSIDFPKKNDKLWRGLGDYHFSSNIQIDLSEPEVIRTQKISLKNRLRSLQDELSRPHTIDTEKNLLNKCNEDLQKGIASQWGDLRNEVGDIQYRLTAEAQELSRNPEGTAERSGSENAEQRAKAGEQLMYEFDPTVGDARRVGWGITGIDQSLKAFYDQDNPSKNIGIRAKLKQLDDLFIQRDPNTQYQERFGDPEIKQAKLRSALKIISDIEREGGNLTPEQRNIIEGYENTIRGRAEYLSREGEPPNRLYLTRMEQTGLENDPIGTTERMYLEAMKAFQKDPDGPLAKFYLDRLELMEYYLFSRQHGEQIAVRNFQVILVDNMAEVTKAVDERRKFAGTELTQDQMFDWQSRTLNKIVGREKENLERSFSNRFHEILFIQQWKHASSAGDEHFQQFLNSRMLEDDFWGMDGQFGGLLKQFRMTLARKYEAQLFDVNGNKNPHVDRLWDIAINETVKELSDEKKYVAYKDTWNRYINGDFFMDVPDKENSGKSVLRRKPETLGAEVPPPLEYSEAVEMITQFAAYRMIMSEEKYLTDMRFLPIEWGKNIGKVYLRRADGSVTPADIRMEITTEFYEKQKIAKLANSFEQWMITWGGITQGLSGEERLMLRSRGKLLQTKIPELKRFGREWAEDWMETRVSRYKEFMGIAAGSRTSDQKIEMERIEGEMKSLFSMTADPWDSPREGKIHDIPEWISTMTMKKLQEETTFYASMRASATAQGLTFYMGVSESGARRDAQMGSTLR